MRGSNGMEITGEVEVHLLGRVRLRFAAARRSAFHPEDRSQRRLSNTDQGVLPDVSQAVAKAHGGDCFALSGGGWGDSGDDDEFALGSVGEAVDGGAGNFGFVVTIGENLFGGESAFGGDFIDGEGQAWTSFRFDG